MNDPRRSEPVSAPPIESGSSGSQGYQAPPLTDPAYADQAPYASTYGGQFTQWAAYPTEAHSTRPLPRSWQHDPAGGDDMSRHGFATPPPEGPKAPRWLVFGAVVSVLLVVGLIVALIIANGGSKTQTAIEPLPPMPAPTSTPTLATPRTHYPSAAPLPPTIAPSEPTEPGALQPVVYSVTGEGRVISITYMNTGDVMQTEFNVALPWTKEVSLSKSPTRPASVTILNFGHNVTCSVTVAGVQVREREGVGLTICDGATR
jgi:Mycobacterium membrane protein